MVLRTLSFYVQEDEIKRDPACSFSNLKPDEPLMLEFIRLPLVWHNHVVVVEFLDRDRKECPPQVLEDGRCMVPKEAMNDFIFYFRLLGKRDDHILETTTHGVCFERR